MSVKTKAQLRTQNDNLITTNGDEEITGTVLNGHLDDFIDSFAVESSGSELKSVPFNGIIPSGTVTSVIISDTPLYDVFVYVNGERHSVGDTTGSSFYFMDSINTTVHARGDIVATDSLNYNATALEFSLDSADDIILSYLIEA